MYRYPKRRRPTHPTALVGQWNRMNPRGTFSQFGGPCGVHQSAPFDRLAPTACLTQLPPGQWLASTGRPPCHATRCTIVATDSRRSTFTRNDLHQITQSEQAHDGAVTGGMPAIQYANDLGADGTSVYNGAARLETMAAILTDFTAVPHTG